MKPYDYTITRSRRRRTVAIRIRPNGAVEIVAPAVLKDGEIARIAQTKQQWVERKLEEFGNRQFQPQQHAFQEGERFLFLGKHLLLRHADGKGRVEQTDTELITFIPAGLQEKDRCDYAGDLLRHHYSSQAKTLLRQKASTLAPHCGVRPEYVAVKSYRSRWGCCFTDGRLYFNWKIIMAPENIIDYVVIHELCHLREANHSKRFWAMVESVMPDWKSNRAWLKLNGSALSL